MIILQLLFVLLLPLIAQRLEKKSKVFEVLSPIVICYGLGILLANTPGVPINEKVNEWVMNITVPLAISLLLLSSEIVHWLRHSRQLLKSFGLALLAVIAGVGLSAVAFKNTPHVSEAAGMLAGVYSGSTPNLIAVGYAQGSSAELIALTNTSDMFTCAVYLFALLSFFPALLRSVLPSFKLEAVQSDTSQTDAYSLYHSWSIEKKIKSHTASIFIAALVFAITSGLSLAIYNELKPAVVVLGVSTLSIAVSFFRFARRQKASYFSGQYLLMVFCTAMGLSANFKTLANGAGSILAFTACALALTLAFHFLLSYLFKIDADTTIVTSTATIFGPPFIGQICERLKNPALLVPGMIMGVMGIIAGNYFGLMVTKLCLMLLHKHN